MKSVIINGRFMEERMQGIVRYARELTKALDPIITDELNITLLIPPDAHDVPEYENIKVMQIGTCGGIRWEQTALRKYLKSHPDTFCLNLCNVTPLLVQPGITAVHDIMYKVRPDYYTSLRNRISRLWHCLQYAYIAKHERKIITVSNFSKTEIEKTYPAVNGKVEVIPDAWQHVKEYIESSDWQERFPFLKDKQFFFSLATLSKNKNGRWIMEAAKKNPDAVFAVGGKHYETEYTELPTNVHMLGFVSDEDACALMKHCKAFIFPSLYEGFGLPPLEALALGAEVISSNTTSLPEVLGSSVHYIDPNNTDVIIDNLLTEKVGDRNATLAQYEWSASARKLYEMLRE